MNITIENIILIGSVLLFVSIIAGKTTYKLGIPTLLLFLSIGMLAGSEGIGGIYFDNPEIAQFIGIVSLNFILFSGGLDTSWPSVKPVLKEGVMLSTLGVFLTAISLGDTVATAYDGTHGYSDQYILEVDTVLSAAQEAGLTADKKYQARFPNDKLATISINLFRPGN